MEERSGSFLPELPYTNRGVIRQKEELSALIDWCQITIKEVPLEAVIEDVLRIPMELMTVTGYEKGIAGHEVVAIFDNIKVLKPTGNAQYQGFQILMSGKGCRNYENFLQLNEETWFDFLNRVCQYHINFPRIDLAIDDRKPYLSIPDLIIRTKEGLLSTKLREIDFHDSGELKEEVFQSKGGSLYLGSSASNLRLVFYEKGYEQNKKYGIELETKINSELADLEMPNAKFKVNIENTNFNKDGTDEIEFLITTNKGEDFKPLIKTASGGEMSRIMLAIKTVLSDVDEVPILIFDEIDTGISGKAGNAVGEKLKTISKNHQVIIVTHLASIAAKGDSNYYIYKEVEGDNTKTRIKNLNEQEVIEEIARIASGIVSEISLKHAMELRAAV